MTLDNLLGVALDLAYLAVFVFTLLDYVRHRQPVRRAIVLVFASTAIVFGVPVVQLFLPSVGTALQVLVVPALLAQPALVLYLVSYLRPIGKAPLYGAFATCGVLAAALVVLSMSGVPTNSPAFIGLAVGALAYFAIVDGSAAFAFAMAARRRAGASRARLAVASVATGLIGVVVVFLVMGTFLTAAGSTASPAVDLVVRVVGLLSALGYLAAFAQPRLFRRFTQQAILYDFIRRLSNLPSDASPQPIWDLLTDAAASATTARRAEVVLQGASVPVAAGLQRVAVPFRSSRWPNGRLEVDLPDQVLFLEDDLELIGLLVDRAVRSAEREALLVDRERLIDDLRAANEAKTDFLAAMSHELRTPLNAIIGFSELLVDDAAAAGANMAAGTDGNGHASGDTADAHATGLAPLDATTIGGFADHIHRSGLHLLELVNDVLDVARVETGHLELKPEPMELDALVLDTADTVRPLADRKRQVLELDLAPTPLMADPARVRQIVLNLLSNAVKFTPDDGKISLTVDLETPDGADALARAQARVVVADTGRGIAPGDLDRIFEAFQQGQHATGAARQEGTGLGLALTRQLVEAHGGVIAVESTLGRGSAFTVRLPVAGPPPAVAPEPAAAPASEPGPVGAARPPVDGRPLGVGLEGIG